MHEKRPTFVESLLRIFVYRSFCFRCQCRECCVIDTATESVCCMEEDKIQQKIQDIFDCSLHCIIQHPGFDVVCLNQYMMETAYYSYRQHYGRMDGTLDQ